MIEQFCFDMESSATTNPAVLEKIRGGEAARACPGKPASGNPRADTIERYEAKKGGWVAGLESRVQEKIDDTAKDPLLAEPVCVSAVCDGELVNWSAMHGQTEKDMLNEICLFVSENCDDQTAFSGYCINIYDLPLWVTRCRIHGVDLPEFFPRWYRKYWRGHVVDIKDLIWSKKKFLSFDAAATAYGLPGKSLDWEGSPMHGGRVQDALRAGEFDMILKYCDHDAISEHDLLQLCMPSGTTIQPIKEQINEILGSNLSDSQKILTIKNIIGG